MTFDELVSRLIIVFINLLRPGASRVKVGLEVSSLVTISLVISTEHVVVVARKMCSMRSPCLRWSVENLGMPEKWKLRILTGNSELALVFQNIFDSFIGSDTQWPWLQTWRGEVVVTCLTKIGQDFLGLVRMNEGEHRIDRSALVIRWKCPHQ